MRTAEFGGFLNTPTVSDSEKRQVGRLAGPVEDLHRVHDLGGGEVGISHRRRNRGMTCGLLDYLEVHSGLNESAAESVPIIVLPVILDIGIPPAPQPTISCCPT
jgi:hypothetical protein